MVNNSMIILTTSSDTESNSTPSSSDISGFHHSERHSKAKKYKRPKKIDSKENDMLASRDISH